MRKLIRHILKEETNEFELVKNFIYTMYDNVKFVEYIAKRNEVMVYYTNHGKRQMLIPTEICELISNYTGLDVVPWHTDRESDNQPDFYLDTEEYEEEINENYNPAGKEITPNKIVIHKSNPKFRDRISNEGLKAIAGECYKIYAGYGEKCIPAIFATNSTNKRALFDSTYDDDVWEIDTEIIPNVKWYKDKHYESRSKHIVTFENIPADAITLKHEGSGKDWGLMESIDKSEDMGNDIEKNLKVIRMLLKQVNWEGLCDIWVEYDYLDKEYAIKSKYVKKDLRTNNDIQKELVFLGSVIRSMGIMVYIYGPWYVEDCEDEVEFMNESLNESEKDTKKLFKVINNIIDDLILSEYDHIICSYDVKLDEVFNEPVVDVTFIGGYGTKLFPVTQGVQKMYYDILDKIWSEIYDHINIPVGVTMKTTPKCDDQLNESEIKEGKYISVLKDFTEQFKDEDCVCDIEVKYVGGEDDLYFVELILSNRDLDDKFNGSSWRIREYMQKLKRKVNDGIYEYIPISFLVKFRDTPNCRDYNKLNESEEKQPKYLNIIKDLVEPFKDEDGVCDIRVSYDDDDDMYSVYIVMGTEEMNDKFFYVPMIQNHISKLKINVRNTIKDYLPIDNLYVGSYGKPNCNWNHLNESTFFRRRVDMRLMEKEFFENLNIITDVYLRKYIDGINFNFETFENHVIDYFMDGYYNDLTNGGENDYPFDEVYGFLSNHFHNKIKERYDLMFKSNINESVPPQVRRRNEYFDIFFTGKRKNIIYCSFGTPDHLMDWLLELTLEDLYHAWFYETVSDEEWEESIPYIENYIKDKYYEETRQIWMSKCKGKIYESKILDNIKNMFGKKPLTKDDKLIDIIVKFIEENYSIDFESDDEGEITYYDTDYTGVWWNTPIMKYYPKYKRLEYSRFFAKDIYSMIGDDRLLQPDSEMMGKIFEKLYKKKVDKVNGYSRLWWEN